MKNYETIGMPEVGYDAEYADQPQDECGVVGVWAPGEPVAAVAYAALSGLQHRGESAAGVFVQHPDFGIVGHKGNGRVPEAVQEAKPGVDGRSAIDQLSASPVAIGHVRYSTDSENSADAAQPFKGDQSNIAVAHNGHIEGLDEVAGLFGVDVSSCVSDSHRLAMLLDHRTAVLGDVVVAMQEVLPQVTGAYCLTVTDGERLVAARDPWGFHPLAFGRLGDGYMVASEPVVFGSVGAEHLVDIEPGQIIVAGAAGVTSHWIDRQEAPRRCAYEYIYTSRIDGEVDGVPVYDVRHALGRYLAEDYPVEADVVVGMPESGLPAAYGYAAAAGMPLVQGAVKNPYTGRSFLQRAGERAATLVDKLRVIPSQVQDKRIVLVDDSMIKGNSMRANVRKFREAGVREIHVRIAAPPYEHPCYMGMDTGNSEELIARNQSMEEIRVEIGADSLGYITPERVQQAVDEQAALRQRSLGTLCMACSTGDYPFAVPRSSGPVALGMPLLA